MAGDVDAADIDNDNIVYYIQFAVIVTIASCVSLQFRLCNVNLGENVMQQHSQVFYKDLWWSSVMICLAVLLKNNNSNSNV